MAHFYLLFFFQLTMNQKSPAIRYQLPLESCLEDSPGPNPMPVASWTVCHGVLGRDRIGLPRPGVIRRFSFAKKKTFKQYIARNRIKKVTFPSGPEVAV